MRRFMRRLQYSILTIFSGMLQWLQCPLVFLAAFTIGVKRIVMTPSTRAVALGGCGIINLRGWSLAISSSGYTTRTIVWSTPSIYPEDTFDCDLNRKFGSFAGLIAPIIFVRTIAKFQTIVCGFDGFILGISALRDWELRLLRLAKCKVIAFPYGGDAYVYSAVRNESLQHALQISYPRAARNQNEIRNRTSRIVRHADFVVPGLMGFDGIGRWDLLTPNPLVLDVNYWSPVAKRENSEEMRILHTPNHKGFKGTEFLVKAVEELRSEGFRVALKLLEGVSNTEVRRELIENTDVLVEQLIFPGYAMSGVEGLASGVVVIANLEDERVLTPFRRWSFLSECPIISASPETIKTRLLELYLDPEKRRHLSKQSREYAVKRHSFASFASLFVEIDKYIYGERGTLINYYHPLIGEK